MELLINELEFCLANKMFVISLNTALTIPDICSALQSENGCTKGSKYANWVDKYLSPKYDKSITGEDVYKLRCASLHQGKFNHDFPKYEKIIFIIPSENYFHRLTINNSYALDVCTFINDIIEGYKEWKKDNSLNENVAKNSIESFVFHPQGLSPYIVGVPLLA